MQNQKNKIHMDAKDIEKAQKWLKNLGSKITVNGKFSIGMSTALYSFQRKYNIPVTGELDHITWKTLRKENSWFRKLFK